MVEGIVLVRHRLRFRHHLDEQRPAREVAGLDRAQQVPPVALAIIGDQCGGLGIGEVGNSLLRAEMEFHPHALIRRVDHREGVAAEAVHVAEAFRDTALGHHDRDLVQKAYPVNSGAPISSERRPFTSITGRVNTIY